VPKARVSSGIVFFSGSIYIWGLSDGSSSPENLYLYQYSLNSQQWAVVPTTNQAEIGLMMRNYLAAAVYDGFFYVILGAFLRQGDEVSTISRVPISGGAWENVNMGQLLKRNMFAYVFINNSLWILCGSDLSGMHNSVERLNFADLTTTTVFKNTVALKRVHGYSLFRIGYNLVMFGGTDEVQA
jgi:hypothetical protein